MRAASLWGLCLLGCATGASLGPSAEARAGIEEGNRLLVAAALVGNGDRVATVFADDATILPFRLPGTIHGHVAIAEYWRNRLAAARFLELELTTAEVSANGDLAYEVGTFRAKTQAQDAAPVLSTGRYLVVWRRSVDGRWRIQADCPIPDPPSAH
jgi:ketosteroid isomerase-like protein